MSVVEIVLSVLGALNTLCVGGGIITLFTMRSKMRGEAANADTKEAGARKEKALAVEQEIENEGNVSKLVFEYVVNPLKAQINTLTNELNSYKDEVKLLRKDVKRLTKAIDASNNCIHSADCPVLRQLQDTDGEDGSKGKGKSGESAKSAN